MNQLSDSSPAGLFEQRFVMLPTLLEVNDQLITRGRSLDVSCMIGSFDHPFHVVFASGRIIDITPAPVMMRSWRFAFRASSIAWHEYWQPMPRAGWHDLFALTKRGEAVLEGDLLPFMMHLQFFKDVLALPRGTANSAL